MISLPSRGVRICSSETNEKYFYMRFFVCCNVVKMGFVPFQIKLKIPHIITSRRIERCVSETVLLQLANHIFATSENTTITPSSKASFISSSVSLAESNAVDACSVDTCPGNDESSLMSGTSQLCVKCF